MNDRNDAPNVVLLCVDQWRADCLGIEGHPDVETPYLDEAAAKGCRFRRAYAAVPSCIAARASLLTGLRPRTHGRVGYRDGVDWTYPVTLASAFRDQGYQTHCAGKMHVHPARKRMGFEDIALHDGYLHFGRKRIHGDLENRDDYLPWLRQRAGHDADDFDQGTNCNGYTPHPWDKDEALHPSAWVSTMGADFLRRRDPTRPFFLMLSYHRPHPPLDPPVWAYEDYLRRDLAPPVVGDWANGLLEGMYRPHACMHPPGAGPWNESAAHGRRTTRRSPFWTTRSTGSWKSSANTESSTERSSLLCPTTATCSATTTSTPRASRTSPRPACR